MLFGFENAVTDISLDDDAAARHGCARPVCFWRLEE
jgi:hypothetical protein